MRMSVVHIGRMLVLVLETLVAVAMGVLALEGRNVFMLVVPVVVSMGMLVLEGFMNVRV